MSQVQTYITYKADGVTKTFLIPFPYISKSDVYITIVNDGEKIVEEHRLIEGTEFSYLSSNQIEIHIDFPIGTSLIIQRKTEKYTPLVDFMNGSTLTEEDLDLIVRQLLYICQEAYEILTDETAVESANRAEAVLKECLTTLAQTIAQKELTIELKELSKSFAELSKAWAESPESPDRNPESKSAKEWANIILNKVIASYENQGAVMIDKTTLAITPLGLLSINAETMQRLANAETNITSLDDLIVELSVTNFDFKANDARFIRPSLLLSEYTNKTFIQMAQDGAVNVFDKTHFELMPCSIRLNVNGIDRFFVNKTRRLIDPAELLDVGSALENGKDYYIYLVPDNTETKLIVSLNASFPDGYTADNSRKIGGFHTLCVNAGVIPKNIASGYLAREIIPNSIWCLGFRPQGLTSGSVYIDMIDKWGHIYFQSGTGANTASIFNATITDTRVPQAHIQDMNEIGYFLPNDNEFTVMAWGCQNDVAILGGADPVRTGGHKYSNDIRILSTYFLEDITGVLWHWLNDTGFRDTGAKWEYPLPGGAIYGVTNLLAGGAWAAPSRSGLGSRTAANLRSSLYADCSARGLSLALKQSSKAK